MHIRNKFISLCKEAENLDSKSDHTDCRVMENSFQKIIKLGDMNPNCNEFIMCLIDIIHSKINAPEELLPYLMRHFKYTEVLEASRSYLGDPPRPRYMNFHSSLVHAVEDDIWSDSGMWLYIK